MSLEQLEVQVTHEHLKKLLKTRPIKALEELIWNALDADANKIDIIFEKNEIGGIESIIISDNGHGMNYNHINDFFGNLGNSYKLGARFSPTGRKYHGHNGEGRYRAFVLGEQVEWLTVCEYSKGDIKSFKITGKVHELRTFSVSKLEQAFTSNTGVTVKLTNLIHEHVDVFSNNTHLIQQLTSTFAPYILAHKNIKIIVDGIEINAENFIKNVTKHSLFEILETGELLRGKIKIIEWKAGTLKNAFLGDENDEYYDEETSGLKAGAFSHTVYITSSIIKELYQKNEIQARELDERYKFLKDTSVDILRTMYREKLSHEASEEIKWLKEKNIYPYMGEPKNEIEKATRQVFDIFAFKINELIPEFSKATKNSKQFTYRLLKEALELNPSSLETILKEVLELSPVQQDELASLLEKTSLESIINTTTLITNRIKFLYGLEEILYGVDFHKRLKERSQLHKILLDELWLFGEHYTYSYDDISLKNILKKHIKELGRNDLLESIDINEIKNLNDIPDIGLSRQCILGEQDHYENLVIELKRPSCIIGQKEITQIKSYAFAIEENEYFDKEKTKWKFILIGVKLDKFTLREINQQGRAKGHIYTSADGHVEVWVKEWGQIIQDAKGKYHHLKNKLELEVKDNKEGLEYLQEKYKVYLPN